LRIGRILPFSWPRVLILDVCQRKDFDCNCCPIYCTDNDPCPRQDLRSILRHLVHGDLHPEYASRRYLSLHLFCARRGDLATGFVRVVAKANNFCVYKDFANVPVWSQIQYITRILRYQDLFFQIGYRMYLLEPHLERRLRFADVDSSLLYISSHLQSDVFSQHQLSFDLDPFRGYLDT
jgi:hypothetical protein